MEIPYFRPNIEQPEIDEVVDTLRSGWLTTGPKTKQFEARFAQYLHKKHAVAANSCTATLHLALEAIGVKANDTVVVPTWTFAATAEVVCYFNARPLLVDCRESDFGLDAADAERRIQAAREAGEKVVAIMPVHFAGLICDLAGVRRLAQKFDLKIVEDAAHCCPAFYRDSGSDPWRPVGAEAMISCFSFYANKNITTGEGGMACTEDDALADRMRIMSLHGISRDAWKRFSSEGSWYFEIQAPGFKYNMTDIAASIGLHQLAKADRLHARRTQCAERYGQRLQGIDELILPQSRPDRIHSWHLYVIRLKTERLTLDRNQFMSALKDRGIGTAVHWMPLHMHPYYRDTFGYRPADLPVAASIYPQIVSLPFYPEITDKQIDAVCEAIRDVIAGHCK